MFAKNVSKVVVNFFNGSHLTLDFTKPLSVSNNRVRLQNLIATGLVKNWEEFC